MPSPVKQVVDPVKIREVCQELRACSSYTELEVLDTLVQDTGVEISDEYRREFDKVERRLKAGLCSVVDEEEERSEIDAVKREIFGGKSAAAARKKSRRYSVQPSASLEGLPKQAQVIGEGLLASSELSKLAVVSEDDLVVLAESLKSSGKLATGQEAARVLKFYLSEDRKGLITCGLLTRV
jgi:hypothetical protein